MKKQIWILLIFCGCFYFEKTNAQVAQKNYLPPSYQRTAPRKSEIRMTPAQLESLLRQIMRAKQKQIARNNSIVLQRQGSSSNVENAIENQTLMRKLDAIESALLQIKLRQESPVATEEYAQADLQRLEKRMIEEMDLVKSKIANLDQPTAISAPRAIVPNSSKNDSIYTLQLENEILKLNSNLANIEKSLNQLSTDYSQLVKREDLEGLLKKDTIIIRNSINTIPNNINTDDKKYEELLTQMEELKKMMGAMNAKKMIVEPKKSIKTTLERKQVFFQKNTFNLNTNSMMALNQIVQQYINQENMSISITGYADKFGTADYNLTLSQKRAEMVKNYLVSKGIAPSKITSQFLGIDENASDANYARRVEIELLLTTEK